MRLSMAVIYEYFENENEKVKMRGGMAEETLHLKGIAWYQKEVVEKDPDLIYIGYLEDMEEESEERFYSICVPDNRESLEPVDVEGKKNRIYLTGNMSLLAAFSKVQNLFFYYQEWEEELYKALMNNAGIRELCALSSGIFDNMIQVYDRNLFLLASANESKGSQEWEYDKDTGKRILSMDTINDFKLDKKFKETMTTKGIQIYEGSSLTARVLYINFWEEGQYEGRLCISEMNRKFTKTDKAMASYLARNIKGALRWQNYFPQQKSRILESMFLKLLDEKIVDENVFSRRLREYEWGREDEYFCIWIKMDERDFEISSGEVTCHKLEMQFPSAFAFIYKDGILMLVNITKLDTGIHDFYSSFAMFLREGLFKAGISRISKDFFQIREYYEQGAIAFEVGQKVDPMFWYYKFEDYAVSYLLAKGMKGFPARIFCPEGLMRILEYDEAHQTELSCTLRTYLECNMNIAHASEKLFIHRSTFLYRIERIFKISGMDIQNQEMRFWILVSYHLLDYENM